MTLIVAVAFAFGFATTIAEPDVLVLAEQVDRISAGAIDGQVILYVIAIGVAVFVALAMARVVYGISLRLLLTIVLATVILLSFAAPEGWCRSPMTPAASRPASSPRRW
ncbi:MAG: DUF1538 family protein [Pseudorhodoplanes sp.]|nr:DUF1538 family protein [Pseudorhodoplanes sp.]